MKIGAIADSPRSISSSEIVKRTKQLALSGLDSLWTGIHTQSESFTSAGYVAALAGRPRIAVGVVNPYTRHPLIVARATATLDQLSDHRVILVLGFGWPPWIRSVFSIPQVDPIGDMRSFVTALRGLLEGKTVTLEAKGFRVVDGKISGPPPGKLPIYIAADQKKALELTLRVADGLLIGGYPSPKYVNWVANYLTQFEGGSQAFEICAHLEIRVTKNPAKAIEELKPDLAYFLAGERNYFFKRSGFDLDIMSKIRQSLAVKGHMITKPENLSEAAKLVPDEYVDQSCIVGTIDHCIERLAEYERGGVTCGVLSFQDGFDSVIPQLRKIVQSTGSPSL